jgi:hypothetical protein
VVTTAATTAAAVATPRTMDATSAGTPSSSNSSSSSRRVSVRVFSDAEGLLPSSQAEILALFASVQVRPKQSRTGTNEIVST